MAIFQLSRGVLLQGHHPWGKQNQGFFLKAFCLVFKWKHPESTVWFESSITFAALGFSHALWIRRFMPVVPREAVEVNTPDKEQAAILKDVVSKNKLIFSVPHFTKMSDRTTQFWGAFSKWTVAGKPDASWGDNHGAERAAAALDELEKERGDPCPPTS